MPSWAPACSRWMWRRMGALGGLTLFLQQNLKVLRTVELPPGHYPWLHASQPGTQCL